jgi:hypothetical protein
MSRHCPQGTTFEESNDGALGTGEAHELDADPDDAIGTRYGISHLTCDGHIDRGTEIKAHRHATAQMQSQLVVLPHRQESGWVGVVKLYSDTERRDVDDRALPPQVRRLVLNVAMAHP